MSQLAKARVASVAVVQVRASFMLPEYSLGVGGLIPGGRRDSRVGAGVGVGDAGVGAGVELEAATAVKARRGWRAVRKVVIVLVRVWMALPVLLLFVLMASSTSAADGWGRCGGGAPDSEAERVGSFMASS